MLSSASPPTMAVSGLEVMVEDMGWAFPAPSSADSLTGVFWSCSSSLLVCSEALERDSSLCLSAHFFLCSRHGLFSFLLVWFVFLLVAVSTYPISVLFVPQTEETVSQEVLPKQTGMLEGCRGPARTSLETVPKAGFFFFPCYTHRSTL